MGSRTRFDRYRQPFPCVQCGKRTTGAAGSSGTDLCPRCYERAGLENEHTDSGHAEPVENCPRCEQGKGQTDA